jgi:hypothetical protein
MRQMSTNQDKKERKKGEREKRGRWWLKSQPVGFSVFIRKKFDPKL